MTKYKTNEELNVETNITRKRLHVLMYVRLLICAVMTDA